MGLPSTFVLKSIVVRVGEHLALAVVPADRMVDMRVLDDLLGEETELATEEEVKSAFPDYELGALPPLPGLLRLKALVDPLVFDHEKVAFADGKRTESLLASPVATFRDEEAYVVPISREHEVFGGWS